MYVGWALAGALPHVVIDDPTTAEVEAARQHAMERGIKRMRREFADWCRRNMPES